MNIKIAGINLITSPVDSLTEERLKAINEIMKEEPAGGHKTSAITDVTIRHFVIAYYYVRKCTLSAKSAQEIHDKLTWNMYKVKIIKTKDYCGELEGEGNKGYWRVVADFVSTKMSGNGPSITSPYLVIK